MNQILEGWKNLVWPTEESKKLAESRAKACDSCLFNKLLTCTKCGCPIPAKIRSPKAKCPINRWKN